MPSLKRNHRRKSLRSNRAQDLCGRIDILVVRGIPSSNQPDMKAREVKQPIAITGIGCRFPGGCFDPESFWQMLCQGTDAVTEVPASRWPVSVFFDPEKGRTGKTYSKWGSFLPDVDHFDAGFFGIPDSEADVIDPQQRLLLETAWESLEDAGYVPNPKGERTGVFVGISTRDYELIQGSSAELNEVSPFSATGLATSIAANRISYCFNFTGPSLIVDTACSSSLMSVHLACQSMWNQECEAAIAAGVNCLIGPSNYLAFSSMGLLSPDGRCRSFDSRANGFVRGEGVGALLLQPLDRAIVRGARIYAVILATGANQDGHTPGLAFPSRESQVILLRQASREAGVSPHDLVYVEAHGTGTAAGDPIETSALGEVFGAGRERGRELLIGSVKSNIGHLESGAGIAGIIKCALCLKHGAAPPNLHFEKPNPAIDLEGWRLKVPTQLEQFPSPAAGHPDWYAGVNSFGFGGSNAFVLLRNPPRPDAAPPLPLATVAHSAALADSVKPCVLPISTRDSEALTALAQKYVTLLDCLSGDPPQGLADLAHAAANQRTHHRCRLTVIGRSPGEMKERLLAFARNESHAGVAAGEVSQRTGPVFVFSGQGAQWHAMGRALYGTEPVFRETLEQCHAALLRCGGWPLLPEFLADEKSSRMMDTAIAQPAICAIQIALAAQWAHWGVLPAAAVGHSVGEVAAAYCAGVFPLDEAMRVIFHRADTMARATGNCGMLAAALSAAQAREIVEPFQGAACVGAINSPQSVTLSGEQEALAQIGAQLTERGVWNRIVPVNYAFHSRQMDPVEAPLLSALHDLAPRPAQIPVYSTVTGKRVEGPELDARYWWRNVRETVQFAPAIEALAQDGYITYVEVAAHPVLSASMKQTLQPIIPDDEAVVLPSLRRQENDHEVMLQSLGTLHCLGHDVAWERIGPRCSQSFVRLPSYPWKHRRHWNESPEWSRVREFVQRHPLLMRRSNATIPTWQCLINTRLLPYVKDHAIQGRSLFPATGYLELAHAAATELYPGQVCQLLDVDLERALFLPEGGRGIDARIEVDPTDRRFSILSGTATDQWTRNARGMIQPRKTPGSAAFIELDAVRQRCTQEMDSERFYAKTRQSSFNYGPMFRGVQQVWRRDGEALARIAQHPSLQTDTAKYRMHPALLDACVQLAFVVMRESDPHAPVGMFLPYSIDRLQSLAPLPNEFWAHAELVKQGRSTLVVNIQAVGEDGRVLVELEGVKFRPMEGVDDENFLNWFYTPEWVQKPLPEVPLQPAPASLSTYLPPMNEIVSAVRLRAGDLRQRMLLPQLLQETRREIRELQGLYLLEALRELGWEPDGHVPFTTETLIAQLGIGEGARSLLDRGLWNLSEQAWLKQDAHGWLASDLPDRTQSAAGRWRSLVDRYPALLSELMLLKHWGESLTRGLSGERATPQLDELARLQEQAVHSAPTWAPSHLAIRHVVAGIVSCLPPGRRLKMLELKAGTSGLSAHLVPELTQEQAECAFTDPNAHLPSTTEDRIRQYGFGDCRTLNLAAEVQSQGFEAGQFDLLIGQDPFGTAEDVCLCLKNARQLLAPSGLLMFSEWDSGAWMGEVQDLIADQEHIPSRARNSRSQWLQLLAEAGFVSLDCVADLDEGQESGRTVYIAQRPDDAESRPALPMPTERRHWLILGDRTGVGECLAGSLRDAGHMVRVEQAESACDRIDTLLTPEVQGIVHLWSLDAPRGSDTLTLDALQRAQQLGPHSVLRLIQAIGKRPGGIASPRLWLITRGAQPVGLGVGPMSMADCPLIGFGRVLANEHPDLKCRLVDLSPAASLDENVRGLVGELLTEDRDEQVALRGLARYVERISHMSTLDALQPGDRGMPGLFPCQLRIGRPGMLDQLRLRPIERRAPGPDEVEVTVCAAGLNFRDVMKSLGVYPGDAPDAESLGDEFAGIVLRAGSNVRDHRAGDRVFGVTLGAMATHVTVPGSVCLPIPADMSFEEAATIPVVYLTAYHALHKLAHAQAGERILIHSAAGGVGWAAVRLALQAGLEVFGTAGSPMKRQLLRNIGVHHVSNSRTLEFADEIMALTRGEGIDIVLNSLAGEAIPRSLETLRLYGRFLEIGKRDIYGGTAVNLKPFRNSLSYHAIDMARTLVPPHAGPLLNEVLELVRTGAVAPLPYQSFPFAEAARAFRHMAQGKHTGKIVLTVDQTPVARRLAYDASRYQFRGDGTYLITGGLRGLGLFLAEHLASRGARHLVLTSQSGPESEESQAGLARLQARGLHVMARKSDITSESQLADLLAEIDRTMPPLAGVIHAATVYGDGLLREMTAEVFEKPMGPKAYGAWNLHRQTLDRKLELFVTISSVSAVIGNAGQANYVAANVFLDALAQHRRGLGLPALSVQLDRIRDVGHVARSQELSDYFSRLRWWGITSEQAAEGLDRLLANQATVGLVSSFKWTRSSSGIGTLLGSPRFERLVRDESSSSGDGSAGIRRRLDAAAPEEKSEIVRDFLLREIADVLRTSARKLPHNRPLKEIGLDSLMAVELLTRIESKLGTALPAQHLSADATVTTLTNAALSLLGVAIPSNAAPQDSQL